MRDSQQMYIMLQPSDGRKATHCVFLLIDTRVAKESLIPLVPSGKIAISMQLSTTLFTSHAAVMEDFVLMAVTSIFHWLRTYWARIC